MKLFKYIVLFLVVICSLLLLKIKLDDGQVPNEHSGQTHGIELNTEDRLLNNIRPLKVSFAESKIAFEHIERAKNRAAKKIKEGSVGRAEIVIAPLLMKIDYGDEVVRYFFDIRMNAASKALFFSEQEKQWFLELYRKYGLLNTKNK